MSRSALTPELLTDILAQSIHDATKEWIARVKALEARCHELEQREYQGTWDAAKAYAKGALTTHSGSLWHSNVHENRATPGQHPHWTLVAKRGRDGREARP